MTHTALQSKIQVKESQNMLTKSARNVSAGSLRARLSKLTQAPSLNTGIE